MKNKQGRTPLDIAMGVGAPGPGAAAAATRPRRCPARDDGDPLALVDGGRTGCRVPRTSSSRGPVVMAVSGWLGCMRRPASASSRQNPPAKQSVWDGVYTEAQAARGERQYGRSCEQCHGRRHVGRPGRGNPVAGARLVHDGLERQDPSRNCSRR